MHRTSDSRRYREGDSFESAGDFSEFEARGGSAYNSASSSDSPHRGLRWRDTGVFGSGSLLSGRRVTARRAIVLGLLGAFAFACLPRRPEEEERVPPAGGTGHRTAQRDLPERTVACNPYELPGILVANWTEPSGNSWVPIAAPASCQPVDWLSLLRSSQVDGSWYPQLEWARNRTIAIFGDSVDRDHIEHTCEFVNGELERIDETSPFSPEYPIGQERPPPTYKNAFTQNRSWTPDYDQSRPHICHIPSYNIRVVSVFHFGFQDLTDWLLNYYHYYPPTIAKDRFELIMVPLLANLGDGYESTAVPDLVSVSTGFWDLLKHSIFDDAAKDLEVKNGRDPHEATIAYDTFRTMSVERRAWFEHNIRELFLAIAGAWPEEKGKKPKILLRSLHHPQANHLVPITGVQTIDQISRSVVAQLRAEGAAAAEGEEAWKRWSTQAQALFSLEPVDGGDEGRTWRDALKLGLGTRLGVDEWGRNILGQELRQRDHLHPLPLPSNYLYGNMLFQHLKLAVEEQEANEAAEKDAADSRGGGEIVLQ